MIAWGILIYKVYHNLNISSTYIWQVWRCVSPFTLLQIFTFASFVLKKAINERPFIQIRLNLPTGDVWSNTSCLLSVGHTPQIVTAQLFYMKTHLLFFNWEANFKWRFSGLKPASIVSGLVGWGLGSCYWTNSFFVM